MERNAGRGTMSTERITDEINGTSRDVNLKNIRQTTGYTGHRGLGGSHIVIEPDPPEDVVETGDGSADGCLWIILIAGCFGVLALALAWCIHAGYLTSGQADTIFSGVWQGFLIVVAVFSPIGGFLMFKDAASDGCAGKVFGLFLFALSCGISYLAVTYGLGWSFP